jgi:hypothetical protein
MMTFKATQLPSAMLPVTDRVIVFKLKSKWCNEGVVHSVQTALHGKCVNEECVNGEVLYMLSLQFCISHRPYVIYYTYKPAVAKLITLHVPVPLCSESEIFLQFIKYP